MIRLGIKYSLAFVMLILLQVLVFNNLHLSIYVNPYAYILFILILPFEISGWLLLSLAFITGMTMDAFCNTVGMHSASLVFMAFLRPYLLKLIAPRDGYESGQSPHYGHMGIFWFLIYAGILTFAHHFVLFLAEDFRLDHFFILVFKSLISSILSIGIMFVLLLVSYKPSRY
jgi:rod shape-determining protein MreD